jgi:transaldolase
MRLFIDTGNVAEVEEIAAWGVLSGATTNPSLLAKEDGDPGESIKRICDLVGGPTSAEVVSEDVVGMLDEGRALRELHEHIVVKVPFNEQGLEVTAARIGCEIATTPAKVLRQMLNHPLTDSGAEKFREDWQSRPEFGEWLGELTRKRLATAG